MANGLVGKVETNANTMSGIVNYGTSEKLPTTEQVHGIAETAFSNANSTSIIFNILFLIFIDITDVSI